MKTKNLLIGAGVLGAAYLYYRSKSTAEVVAVVTPETNTTPIPATQAASAFGLPTLSTTNSTTIRPPLTKIGNIVVVNRVALDKLKPYRCTDGKVRNLTDPTWLCPTLDRTRPYRCTDGKVRNLTDPTWLCPTLSTQAMPTQRIAGGYLN